MNAQLQDAPGLSGWLDDSHDDCLLASESALLADPKRLVEIDADVAQSLDGSDVDELFALLADCSGSGMVMRLAQGDSAESLNYWQSDRFRKFARLADRMDSLRQEARKAAYTADVEARA